MDEQQEQLLLALSMMNEALGILDQKNVADYRAQYMT